MDKAKRLGLLRLRLNHILRPFGGQEGIPHHGLAIFIPKVVEELVKLFQEMLEEEERK